MKESPHHARLAVSAGLALALGLSPVLPALAATPAAAEAATPVEAQSRSFSDVNPGDWYADGISFCADHGIMGGYGGTDRFGVGDELRTEELAQVLFNVACRTGRAKASDYAADANETGLADVGDGQWYDQAVNWAKATGVINGYGGTDRFGVGDPVTAERLCAILYNFTGQTSSSTSSAESFSDYGSIPGWARPAVAWARDARVLSGYPDGRFGAGEHVMRERVATIMMNACDSGVISLDDGTGPGQPGTADPTYVVAFDGNGATSGSMASQTLPSGRARALPRSGFARTGYEFLGWARSGSAAAAALPDGASVTDLADAGSTVTLYAVWRPVAYTVRVDANGGSGGSTVAATYDRGVTPKAPTRAGYALAGYNSRPDGTGTAYPATGSLPNLASTRGATVTLYAQWQRASLPKATFSGATAQAAVSDDGYVTLPTATREGYSLAGWTASGRTYEPGERVRIASDTTFAAVWKKDEARRYKATLSGVSGQTALAVSPDNAVTLPATATNAADPSHWRLSGWYANGWTHKPGETVTLTADTTFEARWDYVRTSATVRFDANGGRGSMDPIAVPDVSAPAALPTSTLSRDGYAFRGWSTTRDGQVAYADGAPVSGLEAGSTTTLYAVWESDGSREAAEHEAQLKAQVERAQRDLDAARASQGSAQSAYDSAKASYDSKRSAYESAPEDTQGLTAAQFLDKVSDGEYSARVKRAHDIYDGQYGTGVVDGSSATYDSILAGLDYIDEFNRFRASKGLSTVRVSGTLTAGQTVEADLNDYHPAGADFYRLVIGHSQACPGCVLSWGDSDPIGSETKVGGWLGELKQFKDWADANDTAKAKQVDWTNPTDVLYYYYGITKDQLDNFDWSNYHGNTTWAEVINRIIPYPGDDSPYNRYRDNPLGHWIHLVDPDVSYAGFGWTPYCYGKYLFDGNVAAMDLADDSSGLGTVGTTDDFRRLVSESRGTHAKADAKAAMDSAKSSLDDAKAKLDSANQALAQAESALDAAKAAR